MKVLKRLKITNFLWTKSREIDFDLLDSIVFITGENAGWKTTIMRAIYFALTWEDAFFWNKKTDGLINDYALEMTIELELENRWKNYLIVLNKKKNKPLDIDIYEEWISLLESKLNKEAKEILCRLFWNPTAILSTYFIFWDNKNDFVDNTPMERLKIITRVSDAFRKYENISLQAKWFIKKLELEKNQKIGQLELASNNVKELEEKIKDFKEKDKKDKLKFLKVELESITKIEKIKEDIAEIDNKLKILDSVDIKEIVSKIEDNKKNIKKNESINIRIKELEVKKGTLLEVLTTSKIELTKQEWIIKNIESTISANKNYIKEVNNEILDSQKETIIIAKERIQKWKDIIASKLEEWTDLKTQIDIKESDIKKIDKDIFEKEQALIDTKKLFEQNNHCPLCHNALTEKSLNNYKKFIEDELVQIKKNKENILKDIATKTTKKNAILSEWKNYNNIVKSLELYVIEKEKDDENKKILWKIKELESEIVRNKKLLETIINENNKNIKAVEDINILIWNENKKLFTLLSSNELNKYEDILKTNEKSALLEEQKNELLWKIEEKYKKILLEDIKSDIYEKNSEISQLNTLLTNFASDKDRLTVERKKEKEIKDIVFTMNTNIEQYEDLQKLFWKDWIQKRQIQMLLWEIEVETNALVKKFFDNIWVKFWYNKKGIDLKILRRVTYNDWSYEHKEDVIWNFSDAQQEVLKVLLKISFSKVVQNLNNTPLNILFLNETFNTLSKEKESLLVETLNYYSKYYHITFITHNEDLIWNFGWSNIYDINEEKGS